MANEIQEKIQKKINENIEAWQTSMSLQLDWRHARYKKRKEIEELLKMQTQKICESYGEIIKTVINITKINQRHASHS